MHIAGIHACIVQAYMHEYCRHICVHIAAIQMKKSTITPHTCTCILYAYTHAYCTYTCMNMAGIQIQNLPSSFTIISTMNKSSACSIAAKFINIFIKKPYILEMHQANIPTHPTTNTIKINYDTKILQDYYITMILYYRLQLVR